MRQILIITTFLLLTGCMAGGERVEDFTNRSTAYGWVNIDEVDGNRLYEVMIKQYRPRTEAPYYSMGVKEFKGGFLFHTNALTNGSFKLDVARAQSCFGLCSNTIYSYQFGSQGDEIGTAVIDQPGVYYLGSYDMVEENTGWLEQSKFSVKKAAKAPSRKEMLDAILADAPQDHPVVAARIRGAHLY